MKFAAAFQHCTSLITHIQHQFTQAHHSTQHGSFTSKNSSTQHNGQLDTFSKPVYRWFFHILRAGDLVQSPFPPYWSPKTRCSKSYPTSKYVIHKLILFEIPPTLIRSGLTLLGRALVPCWSAHLMSSCPGPFPVVSAAFRRTSFSRSTGASLRNMAAESGDPSGE